MLNVTSTNNGKALSAINKLDGFSPVLAGLNRRRRLDRIAEKLHRVDHFNIFPELYWNFLKTEDDLTDLELEVRV